MKFIHTHHSKGRIVSEETKNKMRGSNNWKWQGEKATYHAGHERVKKQRGQPTQCEVCKMENPDKDKYEWANLTGKFYDILDYKRMCLSCHRKHDAKRRKEYVISLESKIKELEKELKKYEN